MQQYKMFQKIAVRSYERIHVAAPFFCIEIFFNESDFLENDFEIHTDFWNSLYLTDGISSKEKKNTQK